MVRYWRITEDSDFFFILLLLLLLVLKELLVCGENFQLCKGD